jgi:hypothetical protein
MYSVIFTCAMEDAHLFRICGVFIEEFEDSKISAL